MAYDYHEVFLQVEKWLSVNPAYRLYELARQLGCSHPTIEKAILQHTALSFREYQKLKLLQKGIFLLRQGYKTKEIGLELGYKWPENFCRFIKQSTGCSISDLNIKNKLNMSVVSTEAGEQRIFNK